MKKNKKITLSDLVTIKQKVVRTGFPELTDIQIEIDFEDSDDEMLGYGELEGGGYYIDVDIVMRKASLAAIEGGLAHELAHISIDQSMDDASRFLDDLAYEFNEEYQTNDERKTDLLVIKRGYGIQLLKFFKFYNKRYKPYTKEDGLTKREIKEILKQRGEL